MASERSSADYITVIDRKTRAGIQKRIKRSAIPTFEALEKCLREVFRVETSEKIQVLDDANLEIVDDESLGRVATNQVLYLWRSPESSLCNLGGDGIFDSGGDAASSRMPTNSVYHPCKVKNPLVAALANLIDGAIFGTAFNERERIIEISLHSKTEADKDGSDFIILIDNGRGMVPSLISKWATSDSSIPTCAGQPPAIAVARSLTGNLSPFCVGDKKSIFAVGSSFQLFTRKKGLQDVYRFRLSREDFDRMTSLDVGYCARPVETLQTDDMGYFDLEEHPIIDVIRPMLDRDSYTAVVISDIPAKNLLYLREKISEWTTELAHMYHYYIHGKNGNVIFKDQESGVKQWSAVQIKVDVYTEDTSCVSLELSSIDKDFQSQCIMSCTNVYDFKVYINDSACVEGLVRYHPILNGRETYPNEKNWKQALDLQDGQQSRGRGNNPIFECFWNGRLMPCTTIEEFDWCSSKNRHSVVPKECFSRLSGVLFADNSFLIRPDKHGFVDLAAKLNDKESTTFVKLSKIGTDVMTAIEKDFADWLNQRHFNDDKKIKFRGHRALVQYSVNASSPTDWWSEYNEIDWNGTVFRTHMMVRSTSVNSAICGTVVRFLLKGKREGDVFGADGIVEVIQEPRSLYGNLAHFAISNLDRNADPRAMSNHLEMEMLRLPLWIDVQWPEGQSIDDCSRHGVGTVLGSVKVRLFDGMNETVFQPPGPSRNGKLFVEMKLVHFDAEKDVVLFQAISAVGELNSFWFNCSGLELQSLGHYSIFFQVLSEEENRLYLCGKELPCSKINFTVKEGDPESFTIRYLDGPFCVGIPFQIPLEFADKMGNMTKPDIDTLSPALELSECSDIELTHGPVVEKDGNIIISDVIATGTVTGKALSLKVTLPSLKGASQTLKMRLLPGTPTVLIVEPEELTIEHGRIPQFTLKLTDKYNNVTGHPMARVCCKFLEVSTSPVIVECVQFEAHVATFDDFVIDGSSEERRITALFEVQGVKGIPSVKKSVIVMPSSEPKRVRLFYFKGNVKTEINDHEDLYFTVGSSITKLEFEVYDEAGRRVPCDRLDFAYLKVNWSGKLGKETSRGRLPDVKVSNSVAEIKRCIFTYGPDQDFVFSLRPLAAEPSAIVCKASGSTVVRLGQTLSSHILVTVYDQYGNVVQTNKNSLAALSVQGEGLVIEESVRSLGQSCNFDIGGIRFADKKLGQKDITVDWNGLKGSVEVTVSPGLPSTLRYLDWPLDEMPISASSGEPLPYPLRIQLCDHMGNAVNDKDIKVQMIKPSGIKLSCETQLKTDAGGRVNFGKPCISGSSGTYELTFKAFVGRAYITCRPLSLTLNEGIPAATKVEVMCPAENQKKLAGSTFDVFKVTVASGKAPLRTPDPSALTMKLVACDNTAADSPKTKRPASTRDVSREMDCPCDIELDSSNGTLLARNAKVPEVAGNYEVLFSYRNSLNVGDLRRTHVTGRKKAAISSVPQKIVVVAGEPTMLRPVALRSGTVFVDVKDMMVAKRLVLEMQDAYGNRTGFDVEGTILASIVCEDPCATVPKFSGGIAELRVPLSRGRATFKRLKLESGPPGNLPNHDYRIEFKASSPALAAQLDFSLPFIVKIGGGSEMSASRREFLLAKIREGEEKLATYDECRKTFSDRVKTMKGHEARLRNKLRAWRSPGAEMALPDIRRLVQHKTAEYMSKSTSGPKRCKVLETSPADHDLLGKVCHLAYIEEDDVARVISWHLASHMDVMIVRTNAKALQMSAIQSDQSSFLAVDTIEDKHGAGFFKSLPHDQLGVEAPVRNISYAKLSLRFIRHYDECILVFGLLLGDTLLADSLSDGFAYRSLLMQAGQTIPTILTRDGYRLPSAGLIGGMQNTAPAIADLNGFVFDKPPIVSDQELSNTYGLLLEFESFLTRLQEAVNEIHYLDSAGYTSHFQNIKLEVDAMKKELESASVSESGSSTACASAVVGERVQLLRPTLVIALDDELSVDTQTITFAKLLNQPYVEGEEVMSPTPRPEGNAAAAAAAQRDARNGSRPDPDGVELGQSLDGDFSSFPDSDMS